MEVQRRRGATGVDAWVRAHPLVVDGAFGVVLAAALAVTSLPLLWDSDLSTPWRMATVVAVLVLHATVVVRRRAPVGAYAACCLAMLVLAVSPDLVPATPDLATGSFPPIVVPSSLVFPVLLYAVAAYGRPPFQLLALGPAVLGAIVTVVRLADARDLWEAATAEPVALSGGWPLFVGLTVVGAVLAPWALGQFRRVRTAYVASLEDLARRAEAERVERARQAAADERTRIAREMHDVVAHSLAVIVRQAEGGRYAAASDPGVAVRTLETVAATGREALTDMRAVLEALRTGGPDDAGPQPTVDDLPALVERTRDAGLSVDLRASGGPRPLDRTASLAVYRVVQEALTNVVKHAGPGTDVEVELTWGRDHLDVVVADTGAATTGPEHEPGHGLVGMRERVHLAGGQLEVGPRSDVGFAVRARLPLDPSERTTEVAP